MELSIVLVIIGLLIGGILVAQSMISTVKVQRLASNISQYEIAIINFRQTYKQYPGDSSMFSPPGAVDQTLSIGDSDGDGEPDGVDCNGALSNYEFHNVWWHLEQSGMIKGGYKSFSPSYLCPGGIDDDWYSGKSWPYTELSGAAATALSTKRRTIEPYMPNIGDNFALQMYLDAGMVIPLEQKLGGKASDGTNKMIGLANYNSFDAGSSEPGFCWNGSTTVKCNVSSAQFGAMGYYINPQ